MAYFLKKTNNKKGTYLQIYESYYDPERKGGAHRSHKPIGYVHELIEGGIADPVAHYKLEADKLNRELSARRASERQRRISDESPEKLLGYFPLKNINDSLGVKKYLDLMQSVADYRFNVYSVLSALVYARVVHPCSKSKTYEDVLPKLFGDCGFSLGQVYSCLEYAGSEYEKVIEVYNHQIRSAYPFDTSHTYFDCTNFYFEIDRADDFRRKGPSKENRRDPIVGLGLLLDANQIPIGMRLYPGNESEKPVLRDVIDGLKSRNNIDGRTIQVADKGLNCAENIIHALKNGDGYIFSKSVKMLPETEKTWVTLGSGYRGVKNGDGEVAYWIKDCVDDFEYRLKTDDGKTKVVKLREKRVATYNPSLAKKQIQEIEREVSKAKSLKAARAKKSEYGDSAKYVEFVAVDKQGNETDENVRVVLRKEAIENAKKLAGYNMIVTSELHMDASQIYAAYHNLWRIEESFRVMKSQLDARPVYLQKEETITGHFLICYLAVLLTRILQLKILKGKHGSEEIFEFMRDFHVAKISDRKYINLSRNSSFINSFSHATGLPLTSYFLSDGEIKKMLSHRF